MDYKIVWTNRSLTDLEEITGFIAEVNPEAARKVGSEIFRKVILVSQFPRAGRICPDASREDVREIPSPPYRIIYQVLDGSKTISILTVWHGARTEPKFDASELNERGPAYGSKRHFTAIAAMSLNRVIGNGNQIPWHLPEDFKWFKAVTSGNVIVMGRKTFESIGKPLPNRETIVLSRSAFSFPGVRTLRDLSELVTLGNNPSPGLPTTPPMFQPTPSPSKEGSSAADARLSFPSSEGSGVGSGEQRNIFICGGAQIYEQALPLCSDLFLTLVKREVDGDAFFPPFEDQFELVEEIRDTPEFKILRYRNRGL